MSLEEAHRLLERSREVRWRFPSSSNRAVVAFARGEDDQARGLLGDAETLLGGTDFYPAPDDRFELEGLRERLAEASGARGVQ